MTSPDIHRPGENEPLPLITHPQFVLDPNTRAFYRLDRDFESSFTKSELACFRKFAEHPNRIVTGLEMISALGDYTVGVKEYSKVMVSHIRRKLSDDPGDAAQILRTVFGRGYVLVDESLPLEVIPDVPGEISFQVTIDAERADVLETTLRESGVAVRRLEPGVELFLEGPSSRARHINYPPIEEVPLMPVIENKHFLFDPNLGVVQIRETSVNLSIRESKVLYLLSNSASPVHISKITQYLGIDGDDTSVANVRAVVSLLRKKLRQGTSEDPIEVIPGKSLYRIKA